MTGDKIELTKHSVEKTYKFGNPSDSPTYSETTIFAPIAKAKVENKKKEKITRDFGSIKLTYPAEIEFEVSLMDIGLCHGRKI